MAQMYKCVIFDVDGTLIDTESAVFASYQKVFYEEFQRDFQAEHMKLAYGVPTSVALTRLGFKNVEETEKKYHRYLMEAFCNVKPFDGVLTVLDTLISKGIVMGIVTSRDGKEVANDTCLQGLIRYFDHVVCADDTEKHKPNAEPLLKVIEKAGSEPSKVLYIGDTFYDYLCAKDAGVDFVLALWGAKNISDIHANYNFQKPGDILKLIVQE
jgi:HAD superfamily hydrolase (TIGR01549 family)